MKNNHNIFRILIFVLGISIVLTGLLPVLIFEGVKYAGYEVVFGKELLDVNPFNLGSIASAHLPFSFIGLFAYLLALAAGVSLMVSKRLLVVSLIGFIVSMVLFIMLPDTVEILTIFAGIENSISIDWNIGFGLISAITLTGIAILANIMMVYSKYYNK